MKLGTSTLYTLDSRAIGLFRFVLGLLLIIYWITRMIEMTEYLTNDGLLPNHYALFNPPDHTWSLLNAFSQPPEVAFIMCIFAVFFVCFCLGIGGTIATLGSLLGATSILSRNIWIENGGHVVMNVLLIWSLFLPTEDHWSLKSWLITGRPSIQTWIADNRRPCPGVRSIGSTGIFISCFLIYLFNYLTKVGVTWQSGSAIHYALWLSPRVTTCAIWAREIFPEWILTWLSLGTLYTEGAIPLLLLSPLYHTVCRKIACAAIVVLHLAIAATMNLGAFSFAMICFAIVFYPGERLAPQKIPFKTARHYAVSAIGLLFIATMTIDSISRYQHWMRIPAPLSSPTWVRVLVNYLRIPQNWRMFSTDTPTTGNVVLRIGIKDQTRFDLDSGRPISIDTPHELERYFTEAQPLSILRIESDTRIRILPNDYARFYQHFLSGKYPSYDSYEIRAFERTSPLPALKNTILRSYRPLFGNFLVTTSNHRRA